MLLEPNELSPSREDAPCNSLGASMTWLPPDPPPKPKVTKIQFCEAFQQIWATLAVHCMVIMVGMTLGFSAILIPQLEEPDTDIPISKVDASWLASIVSIVAPIGSLSAGPVVQWLGSKKTIRISLIPYAIGWLLISFANGLPMLLAGRLVTGLATTFGNTPCIVYITEVSSPHLRSMLTATGPTLGSLGILMAYVLGWLFSWRTVALIPASWNLVCIIALATIPESPVWLVSHERFDEARKAIFWFHKVKDPVDTSLSEKAKKLLKGLDISGKGDVLEHEIDIEDDDHACRRKRAEQSFAFLMEEYEKNAKEENYGKLNGAGENLLVDSKKSVSSTGKLKRRRTGIVRRLQVLFTFPTGLKPLLILTIIFLFQQYAGVYITLFYAVNVFKEMGGGALDEYVASILVGVVRFLMSLVNIWLFRKFGRRPLCILSACGMAICMLTSGTFLYYSSNEEEAFTAKSMNLNDSMDYQNWSSINFPQVTSQSFVNLSFDGLSTSVNDHDQTEHHRLGRSLDTTSSEYLSLQNMISGNLTSDGYLDISHRNKTRKDYTAAAINVEQPVLKLSDGSGKSNLFVESENMSGDMTTTIAEESSMDPPSAGRARIISVIPTVCMLLYVCVSMVGFLAIPWTITAELFPTEIRSLANSIVLSLANILLFSALQAYPHMLDALGPHGVLWLFAAVSAGGGIFVYFFLPETHGRNLAEIEKYFAENTVYTYPCKKE